jgi:hypothetical protein
LNIREVSITVRCRHSKFVLQSEAADAPEFPIGEPLAISTIERP